MNPTKSAVLEAPAVGGPAIAVLAPAMPQPSLLKRIRGGAAAVGGAAVGPLVLVAAWALLASRSPDLPTPASSLDTLRTLLAHPFYDGGPNDKGIGLQLFISLERVLVGFALATLVGVPLGLLMGGSRRVWRAANPAVQLLRPVSPLAWFPLGLVVLKDSPRSAVFVIFVTALWPTVLNSAAGAASVPLDHRNVARVFRFGHAAYVRHVMLPHALPSILTGLRLSMGIAWMVIVAVEMLSGNTGIGFFVWNSYNGGNLAAVISAIVLIGGIWLVLDVAFLALHRRVSAKEITS